MAPVTSPPSSTPLFATPLELGAPARTQGLGIANFPLPSRGSLTVRSSGRPWAAASTSWRESSPEATAPNMSHCGAKRRRRGGIWRKGDGCLADFKATHPARARMIRSMCSSRWARGGRSNTFAAAQRKTPSAITSNIWVRGKRRRERRPRLPDGPRPGRWATSAEFRSNSTSHEMDRIRSTKLYAWTCGQDDSRVKLQVAAYHIVLQGKLLVGTATTPAILHRSPQDRTATDQVSQTNARCTPQRWA